MYHNKRNVSGYDDSMRRGDEESFKEVLKFIDQHDLRDVVWNIYHNLLMT